MTNSASVCPAFSLFFLSVIAVSLSLSGSISGSPVKEETVGMTPLSYAQVKEELGKQGTILLDVRNPVELKEDGKIAQSKNIPVGELPKALKMTETDFKKKYGFDKPKTTDHIIVHCKSGVRAQNGAKVLTEAGYSDVQVYPGIMDWKANGGATV